MERTLSIIKPDATERNIIGAINDHLERAGFRIIGQKRLKLSKEQVERFYAVHKERPFFQELCADMMAGPVVVQVLEKDDAIACYRDIMGATDPDKAAEGTLRKIFGQCIGRNSVHGSDSHETARIEVSFFFADYELV